MALQLVGGAFLSAVFNVLLERISSPEVVNFFKKEKISDQLLKNLKVSLLSVTAVLNDAEEKQMINASVKEWLDELKDLAFDADDMLDDIYTDARIAATANKVHTIKPTPLKVHNKDLNVEHNIQAILERFEFIIKQKGVLNLKVGKSLMLPKKIASSSLIEACGVCGRDDEKEDLIKLVLSDDSNDCNIAVIPIVGMGGIGKTTLAQLIYNDARVETEFDLRAWIYVSEEFDVFKITKTLLEVVTSCSCDIKDLNSLQLNLKMRLAKKKFLIVFDDVWNENYINWDSMRSPFQLGAQGSMVILTTRSMRVASIMQTASPYVLGELPDKDCWNLFSKHAFISGDSFVDPEIEEIGRKIVQKCKGLPLAVKTLAGLLRSKSDRQEWLKVLDSEVWDLQDHENNILPALRLSYHYLPPHLKRCFAYCAIFPKNYEFEKEKLILLWMAEDLVQQSKRNGRIEDVGGEYFSELVSRSFFQQSTRDKACFVMHHLVNDLAQFVSGTFLVRLEGKNCNILEERTRYLSHIIAHPPVYVDSVSKATRLRTFLQIRLVGGTSLDFYDGIPHVLLTKLRYLRVLSLAGASIYSLPESIEELKHLRYLDFSGTEIHELPESVANLCNLQTLKLVGCCNLHKLPRFMYCLVDLRYLDISGICLKWMPLQMSKLSKLQMLSDYFVGVENGSSIGELGALSDLHGSLFIHNLKHVVNCKDSEEAKLKEKIFLRKLILDWSGNGDTDNSQHEKNVLDSLQPHSNLKELVIYNYPGTGFPKWLGGYSLCNLVSLELRGCKYCYQLPPLGLLPSLRELQIIKFDGLESVSSEFYGTGTYSSDAAIENFPALEIMRFEHMPMWKIWWWPGANNNGCTAFPRLRELHIESCPSLRGDLPATLPSLTLLTIRDCKQFLCSLPTSPFLRTLIIQNCGDLHLPATASECYQSLTSFYLHNSCYSLEFLSLNLFPSLKSLDVSHCKNLEALTVLVSEETPSLLASLRSLCISHCPKLLRFPMVGFKAPSLTLLTINNCQKLTTLPEDMHHCMPNLKALRLWDCPAIKWTPDMGWLHKLTSVSIQNCNQFMQGKLEWNASNLTALNDLTRFKLPSISPWIPASESYLTNESQISRRLPASESYLTNESQISRRLPASDNYLRLPVYPEYRLMKYDSEVKKA